MTLTRKFIFRDDADVQRFTAFMAANRKPMAEQKRYLQAVVSEYKVDRTAEQNAAMWRAILQPMAEQAWHKGRQFSDEGWNLILKVLFLPETCAKGIDKWLYLDSGERQLLMSTKHLNHEEMALYMGAITAYAADDLGVLLPANPRDI